jgi:nucleotide-binding universal stress UspA family protein
LRRLLGGSETELAQRVETQAHEALQQLAGEIEQQHGVRSQIRLMRGPMVGAITERARQTNAAMLVVGANSAAVLRHWLLGATADRLLRTSTQPMLFVRLMPHEDYRRVLVPVDFSACATAALALARATAPQAQILLQHVCALPFEGKMRFAGVTEAQLLQYRQQARRDAQARLQALADEAGLAPQQWTPVVTQGDPGRDILTQQVERDVDLVVLGKHGAGMTRDLMLGSVTQHVLGQALCDVLVTPC